MRFSLPVALAVGLLLTGFGWAEEAPKGRLLIIGGNLRRENANLYERMIAAAGGRDKARFGILPTASATLAGAVRFADGLKHHGVDAEHMQFIDITFVNAKEQAVSPQVAEQIR